MNVNENKPLEPENKPQIPNILPPSGEPPSGQPPSLENKIPDLGTKPDSIFQTPPLPQATMVSPPPPQTATAVSAAAIPPSSQPSASGPLGQSSYIFTPNSQPSQQPQQTVSPVSSTGLTPKSPDTVSTPTVAGTRDQDEQDFPIYLIAPSTFSYLFSIFIVLVLFLIYLLSIGSIASFDGKFYPNIYMFWDFITTGNTQQYQAEFESYMKNVLLTTQNHVDTVNQDSFVGSKKEGFSNAVYNHPYLDKIAELMEKAMISWSWFLKELEYMWNQLLLNTMIRGNTITVVRGGY